MAKRLLLFFSTIIFMIAFHTIVYLSPWGQATELCFLDLWFHIRGPIAPPENVVVIGMDEDSYQALGVPLNQPWPRALHARLLERLAQVGAKRVAFDVLFLGAGPDPEVDEYLSQALKGIPAALSADYEVVREAGYEHEGLLMPYELLAKNAHRVALAGLPEDDGSIRRFLFERSELTATMPTLSEAAAGDEIINSIRPGPRDLINYYGPPRTLRTLSYYQALETEVPLPPEILRDKIVFVGLSLRTDTGPAQKDAYMTPYAENGRMFGVEIHATATANLLAGNWIKRFPKSLELGVLTFAIIPFVAVLVWYPPQIGIIALFVLMGAWGVIAYIGFLYQIFIPGALVCLSMPFVYLGSTLRFYLFTHKRHRHLKKAFQFYLSPEMVREVSRNPDALKLGGDKLVGTALFTDIAKFTDIAESMQAEDVAHMLNSYFTDVMNVITERQGTLIKFIGDAVFALWGAPIKIENHCELACQCALNINEHVEQFNATKRFPALHTRLGIHSGPMLVGNLGSDTRFDFTAIGDSVNLASRVEGLNKYFGTTILITDAVKAAVGDKFPTLRLGAIKAVGKKTAVTLYALLDKPVADKTRELWEEGVNEFAEQRWAVACKALDAAARADERFIKAAALYLKQIKNLRHNPPPSEWQGEITFGSK